MSVERFGQVEGLTLAKFMLVRKLYLSEVSQIEEMVCGVCSLPRAIHYVGSYDRDRNVESFAVCDSCAKDLIQGSKAIIKQIITKEATAP